MYGILHHLFSTVYFLLFQTYCTFVYLFCVLVYTRGTAPSCQAGLQAWTKPSLLLIKSANNFEGMVVNHWLLKCSRMSVSCSTELNLWKFAFRMDCFLQTVHVHCVNPELCCTNLTSHWYAVIVETTPKPKTFSSLLLQVNPRNWI